MKNPQSAQEISSTPLAEPERSPTRATGPAVSPPLRAAAADVPGSGSRAPTCGVCNEPICVGSPTKQLCCAHVLHAACADRWLRADVHCPVCKTQVLFPAATQAPARETEHLRIHAPEVVAVPLDGTDARHYGVCRDCRQVFYRDPALARPDTLAWFRCPRCRGGDIRDLLRSSCALL